jgi:hypothetical protein
MPFPYPLVVQHTPTTSAVREQMLLTTVCSSTTAYDGTSDKLQMSLLVEVLLALSWQLVLLRTERIP